jgi:hypothetical protein
VLAAGKIPLVRSLLQHLGVSLSRSPEIRDLYSRDTPSPATPFTIFKDEWSSAIPGFKTGGADLFNDSRIRWVERQLGSFQDKRVLELGPLEGGHTQP